MTHSAARAETPPPRSPASAPRGGGHASSAAPAPPPPLAVTGPGELSAEQFQRVAELLYAAAGIRLGAGKEGLVRSRLGSRIRALGLTSFDEYMPHVTGGASSPEFRHFVDVLTTNKTHFFREAAHFDLLARVVLPAFVARDTVQLWSAGCSTGEEPYTLAMILRDTLAATRARILATDISTRVLVKARGGVYPATALDEIPDAFRRHLRRRSATEVEVVEATRALVRFAHLNLMQEWPMRRPFDAIFCRNVMIYFDRPTQERLVQRFESLLRPGGYLFVGHSESLNALDHGLTYVQPAVYRRAE
ncbi:MAG: CheR family methyltransferase [Gemmatimonadaceae bacterium]